jgi:hypothetical protein
MARKEDARRKIQLGGLVVKAGLDAEPPAVVLGLLVEAARALSSQSGQAFRERFRKAGDLAFSEGGTGGVKPK